MFEQYKLPFAYDALEPYIDAATVETHYAKHHATYTKTFNEAAEAAGVADETVEEILSDLDSIPDDAQRLMLRNHGGGYYNHNLYFKTISPNGGDGSLGRTDMGALGGTTADTMNAVEAFSHALHRDFSDLAGVKDALTKAAVSQFGSGWAFLSVTPDGKLVVSKSLNQDNPISEGTGNVPILALDVWEHAYYLKYRNLRADYIKAFFEVVDWNAVAELYARR